MNEDGDIEVYDLGSDGKSTSRVFHKSAISITKEAQSVARTIDDVNFKSIVSINAVEEPESLYINLVAVTKTGVRLYFTTTSRSSPEQRPFCLTLMHIRLPPGFAASSISHRPSSVHISYYKKGNFIFISSFDNKDTLWALSNDSFAFNNEMSELYSIIPLNHKIWSMSEESHVIDFKPYQCIYVKNKAFPLEAPSIVTQHIESPKKFVFLTPQGVIIGYKPRVVDQLKQLLLENQGYDNEAVKSFFTLHNSSYQTNACAIALIIACDTHPPGENRLIEWATSAFFHYGSDSIGNVSFNQPISHRMPIISTPNSSLQISNMGDNFMLSPKLGSPSVEHSFSMSPINRQGGPNVQQPLSTTPNQQTMNNVVPMQNYSSKCRGLFIYFARIIRPIWNLNTVSHSQEGSKDHLSSNITINEIKVYLLRLTSMVNFLQINLKFNQNETDKFFNNMMHSNLVINDETEQNYIFGLYKLIQHCVEVLNLWELLCVHQFHVIVSNLAKDKQTQLMKLTFKELIVFGNEMTTGLASALVRQFIEDNSTTDIINRQLQDRCPSIYKNENALHAKAHEMIKRAMATTNENDRQTLLDNSLELCKKIGPRINLAYICDLFQTVHWYEAIVDICLTTAQTFDPQNIAIHYYKNKEHIDDQQGRSIFNSRIECYNLLLDIYGRVCQQSKNVLSPRAHDPSKSLSPEEAKKHVDSMLYLATQSSDELFHYTLYNWLYEHNQSDKLLEIKSSYLEVYLKEKTSEYSDSIALLDFLWMYYERNGHFNAAAEILAKLAEQQCTDILLSKRTEYLSRAIVCMKSLDTRMIGAPIGKQNFAGEFLHILEEKMEVARIQMQLLNSIEKLPQIDHQLGNAIQILNSSLHNVTTLYRDFAEPFQLYECQLKILHCAGHEDLNLIENIWRNIIEKELLNVANKDAETRKNLLKMKIKDLGNLYHGSDKYFPIGMNIIRENT